MMLCAPSSAIRTCLQTTWRAIRYSLHMEAAVTVTVLKRRLLRVAYRSRYGSCDSPAATVSNAHCALCSGESHSNRQPHAVRLPAATPAVHGLQCGRSVPRLTNSCTHECPSVAGFLPAATALRAAFAAGAAAQLAGCLPVGSLRISLALKRRLRAQRAPRVVWLVFSSRLVCAALRFCGAQKQQSQSNGQSCVLDP